MRTSSLLLLGLALANTSTRAQVQNPGFESTPSCSGAISCTTPYQHWYTFSSGFNPLDYLPRFIQRNGVGGCGFHTIPQNPNAQMHADSWEAFETGTPNPNNTRYASLQINIGGNQIGAVGLYQDLLPYNGPAILSFHAAARGKDQNAPSEIFDIQVAAQATCEDRCNAYADLNWTTVGSITTMSWAYHTVQWQHLTMPIGMAIDRLWIRFVSRDALLQGNPGASFGWRCYLDDITLTPVPLEDLLCGSGIAQQNAPAAYAAPSLTEEVTAELPLIAYPNPSTGTVTIEHGSKNAGALMEWLDEMGRLVLTVALDEDRTVVNMKGLPQGLYLVRIPDGEGHRTIRVAKE